MSSDSVGYRDYKIAISSHFYHSYEQQQQQQQQFIGIPIYIWYYLK